MSTNRPPTLKLRKFLFAALLILICVLIVHWLNEQNKPWIVPQEFKSLKNPLLPSESILSSDAKRMATVTDGEIFYQITEGRRPMPSFKRRLTQDQRWQLVLLVRSFSQPSGQTNPSGNKQP